MGPVRSLVLLKDGRVVFDGPVGVVQDYFSSLGFTAPPNENPMDYYFDVLQVTDLHSWDP